MVEFVVDIQEPLRESAKFMASLGFHLGLEYIAGGTIVLWMSRPSDSMQKETKPCYLPRLNERFTSDQISRSEFLRVATFTGLSATRTFAFLATIIGNIMSNAQTANPRWSDSARKMLREMQEKAYTRLGKQLGLGDDPMTVYHSFSPGQVPEERISSKQFDETFGSTFNKAEGYDNREEVFKNYLKKYHDAELPTPYEEPTLYAVLLEMADSIEEAIKSANLNLPIPRHLLFGTLPMGTIEARTFPVPQTKDHIVVFQLGLFLFAWNMAVLAASAFPPLVLNKNQIKFGTEPSPALALKSHPEILPYFNRILNSYIVLGNPRMQRLPLEPPYLITAEVLLRSMELFVLGHEYTHIILRHVERGREFQETQEDWIRWNRQAEYDADEVGLSLMIRAQSNFDLRYIFWGADYFLSCMDIHERCLSVLKGPVVGNVVQSDHPSWLERRERLYSALRAILPGDETERSIALGIQLHTFLNSLWQQSIPDWAAMHKKGVKPSSIWL